MSSQFNNGNSIDITTLSEEEKTQAFYEWAEGSTALEELLFTCNAKGIITTACCSGSPELHNNEEIPDIYISMLIEDRQEEFLQAIYTQLLASQEECEFTLVVNPDTVKTMLTVNANLDNREKVFSLISQAIKEPKREIAYMNGYEKFKKAFDKSKAMYDGVDPQKSVPQITERSKDSEFGKSMMRAAFLLMNRFDSLSRKISDKLPFGKNKVQKQLPDKTTPQEEKEDKFKLPDEQLKEFNEGAKEISAQQDKENR